MLHTVVVNALIKDGWVITDDPLYLPYGGQDLYVDLGAERPIGAEKGGQRIAVEIKSFLSASGLHDLEGAIGQYHLYRSVLSKAKSDRRLYLAVPERAYESVFTTPVGQMALADYDLQLIVVDEAAERIVQWLP